MPRIAQQTIFTKWTVNADTLYFMLILFILIKMLDMIQESIF